MLNFSENQEVVEPVLKGVATRRCAHLWSEIIESFHQLGKACSLSLSDLPLLPRFSFYRFAFSFGSNLFGLTGEQRLQLSNSLRGMLDLYGRVLPVTKIRKGSLLS